MNCSLVLSLSMQHRRKKKNKTRNGRKSALYMHFLSVTCFDFELTELNKGQSNYRHSRV